MDIKQEELGDLVDKEMAATSAAIEAATARIEVREFRRLSHSDTPVASLEQCCTLRSVLVSLLKKPELPSVTVHVCDLSSWEAKAGGSGIPGCPQLYSKFEASLGYMRYYGERERENF